MHTKTYSRREFLRLAAGSSVGLALAACAPSTSAPQPSSGAAPTAALAPTSVPAAAKEQVTLTFWHPFGGSRIPLIEKMLSDFQAEQPSTKVEHVLWTGADRMEKFIAAVAAGTPPDVVMFRSHDLPAYVEEGVFRPLDDYISAAGINPDELYYKAEIGARRYKGETYGLPTVPAAGQDIAYYNVSRFEEAGLDPERTLETWDEWEEALAKLVDTSTNPPKWFGTIDENVGFFFNKWMYLNGGKYISDDLTKITFNDERGVEALQWMYDFMSRQADYSELRPSAEGFNYVETMRKRFATNQTAVYISGPWMFVQFPEEHGVQIDQFRIHPLPYNSEHPGTTAGVATEGGWGNSLPAGAKHPEASWEFIKFSCASPASLEFTLAQSRPNPVKQYNEDPRYAEANPYWDTILKILDQDFAIPITSAWVEIADIMTDAQEQVLTGKKPSKAALDEAAAAAQRALDKAG